MKMDNQIIILICRLMNIFTHVIEEIVPGPPQMKPTLPSLPNAPSLSPIKRKSKDYFKNLTNFITTYSKESLF
jgi:hypothetical protein